MEPPAVTETPAKRTLDQVSDVETPAGDEPTHKRGKGRGKGKQPLVAPRTTNGQTLQVVVPNHPGNMPSSSPKKPPGRKPTKKSRRNLKGRAAKSKKAASPVSESPGDNQQLIPDQPARRSSPRKSTTRVLAGKATPVSPRLPSVAPLDYEEGITEILMNPSPTKVTRQNVGFNASSKKGKSKPGRPSKGSESVSDGEGENPAENGVENEEDLPLFVEDDQHADNEKRREESIESNELHSMAVDAEHLESLIKKARRVGQTQNRTTKEFADVSEVSKSVTQGGTKIHRRLDTLVSEYEKLQSSKSEGDEDSAKEARETIVTKLQSLTNYATRIVSVKLNGKANEDMVMKLLRDIYFYVLPDWLACIKLAAECYDEDGSMSTRSLKEMHAHLKSWCELAESAISQPTNIQPKGGYQTSKPTREILPQIHKLRKSFHTKISAKSDANPIAKALRLRIEREKKLFEEEEKEDPPPPSAQDEEVQRLKLELAKVRREKEERMERAKRQRINEIHRRQAEQIREASEWQRKQDARFERRAREKLERGSRGYSRSRSLQHRLVDLTREEEDDDDPFADDYQVRPNGRTASVNLGEEDEDDESYADEYQLERVEVFPHNNKSRTTPMPWSDAQKLVFVNCMIRGGISSPTSTHEIQNQY